MSNIEIPQQDQSPETEAEKKVTEKEALEKQAALMGIKHHPNIGVDKLRKLVSDKLEGKEPETAPEIQSDTPTPVTSKVPLGSSVRERAMALVRVRVSSMDPKKRMLFGEVISVSNEFIGTVSKFVPYAEQAPNGYHLPQCLVNVLKQRKYMTVIRRKGGKPTPKLLPEYNIEYLPPLTPAEQKELARVQEATGSLREEG